LEFRLQSGISIVQPPERRYSKTSTIISYRFDRATSQRFLASYEFRFVFRLFTDIGISVLERTGEVLGSSLAADITVDAGRINVESTRCVLFNSVVWVWHESADYADFIE